jgi:hypothetical protein
MFFSGQHRPESSRKQEKFQGDRKQKNGQDRMDTIIVEVPKPVIVPTAEAIIVRTVMSAIYIETLLALFFPSTFLY